MTGARNTRHGQSAMSVSRTSSPTPVAATAAAYSAMASTTSLAGPGAKADGRVRRYSPKLLTAKPAVSLARAMASRARGLASALSPRVLNSARVAAHASRAFFSSFSSFQAYNQMTYSRAELFYHQLRNALGASTMHAVLREYYRRYRFRHVDEARFRQVVEEVSGRDLGAFFSQSQLSSGRAR